jgi:uncharacterized protein (DUF433 family)
MLAEGMSEHEILEDFPELEVADVRACLTYAATPTSKNCQCNTANLLP